MKVKQWLLGGMFLCIPGCISNQAESGQEIARTLTTDAYSESSSESSSLSSTLNTSYTIEDIRQERIKDEVVQRILADAVARLKKQNKFYDTVSYQFELTTQADDEKVSIKVKEQYLDKQIESLSYTVELAEFNQ